GFALVSNRMRPLPVLASLAGLLLLSLAWVNTGGAPVGPPAVQVELATPPTSTRERPVETLNAPEQAGDLLPAVVEEPGLAEERSRRTVVHQAPGLVVVVRDHAGQPVPGVAVTAHDRSARPVAWAGVWNNLIDNHHPAGWTDERGQAVPPQLATLQERAAQSTGSVFLRVGAVTGGWLERRVASDRTGQVVVKLPPTGSLTIRLLEADGSPVLEPCVVGLVAEEPPERKGRAIPGYSVRSKHGVAHFPAVRVGLPLRAMVFNDQRGIEMLDTVQGPRVVGQQLEQTIHLGQGTTLSMLLMDSSGQWMAKRTIVAFVGGSLIARRRELDTWGNGRLRLGLHEADDPQWIERGSVPVRLYEGVHGPQGGEAWLNIQLPLPPGEVDLGRVRLGDHPFVSGTVVDRAGRPVEHAYVEVVASSGQATVTNHVSAATTPADGRFRLQSPVFEGPYALRAKAQGLRTLKPLPFEPGGEVTLRLDGVGSLRAEVAGVSWIHARWSLSARLAREDGSALVELEQVSFGPASHGFRGDEVPSGRWRVELFHAFDEVPLARVPGLQIEAGQVCEDERIQPIDLSGLLTLIALRVRTSEGAAIEGWSFHGRLAGSDREHVRLSVLSELLVPVGHSLEGYVVADGYAPKRVRDLDQSRTVRLERGAEMQFHVGGLDPEKRHWLTIEGGVDAAKAVGGLSRFSKTIELDSEGTASLTLGLRGSYTVGLSSARPPMVRSAPRRIGTFKVRVPDFGQAFTVALEAPEGH
ncbi:MAG: carboxypeptidase-like regulatory domain-containing protein, partial [Planctomycetota bacterium]